MEIERAKGVVICVTMAMLILAACGQITAPAPAAPALAPAPAAVAVPVKAAWETKWENVVEAAKKEQSLVLLTSRPVYRTELAPLFKRKYGVTIDFIAGGVALMTARILRERRAGIYSYDGFSMGSTTAITTLKPAGAFDPLEPVLVLPEVTDSKGWYDNKLPWVDRDHTLLETELLVQPTLAINTNLVKPEQLKSYLDLLDPRWKGKILLSQPFTTGVGSETLGGIATIMGWDYLRELNKNQPVAVDDYIQARDWLAHGKAAVVIAPQAAYTIEVIRVGVPIALHNPQEGGFVRRAVGVGMINRAPHPNAAKLFINWLLSKEGQTVASEASGVLSCRVDVPTDFIYPLLLPQPGVKYIQGFGEEHILAQADVIKKVKEIFAPK